MWFCLQNKLPPLTVLVVNNETGTPSEGLIGVDDFDIAREQVFNEARFDLVPPTISQFKAAQSHAKSVDSDLGSSGD